MIQDPNFRKFLNDLIFKKTKEISFEETFPGIENDALDLLKKLLTLDPSERISASEALEHPYFKDLHQNKSTQDSVKIDYFDFEFEQYTLDKKILRELILDEAMMYHSPEAVDYYKNCKAKYPGGILEKLYQRVEDECEVNI